MSLSAVALGTLVRWKVIDEEAALEVTGLARLQPRTTGKTVVRSTQRHSDEVDSKHESGYLLIPRSQILTIPAVSRPVHAGDHPQGKQRPLILPAGVLTPAVGVMQQTRERLSRAQHHLQGRQTQVPVARLSHRPTHHSTREQAQRH